MAKGLAWVGSSANDSGQVLIQRDDGREDLIPTIIYAVSDIDPPLHELPLSSADGSINASEAAANF